MRGPRVRKKCVEAPGEVQHREIETAFQKVIGSQLRGDATRISTDPAAAGHDRAIDREADRTRHDDLLIMGRPTRIADGPVRRLRAGIGIAMPLVERVRGRAATTRKVHRDQQIPLRSMATEVARAACGDTNHRL